jgi:hypothetical protein
MGGGRRLEKQRGAGREVDEREERGREVDGREGRGTEVDKREGRGREVGPHDGSRTFQKRRPAVPSPGTVAMAANIWITVPSSTIPCCKSTTQASKPCRANASAV